MKILIFSLLILTCSCAAVPVGPKSAEMNKLHLGMSEEEVVSTIGQPSRTSAKEEALFLIYRLVDAVSYQRSMDSLGMAAPETRKSDYFVKLQNNKVISFGKLGDFGTSPEY